MLFRLKKEEFSATSRIKTRQKNLHATTAWYVMGAISACWLQELGGQKHLIMTFVWNRTLYYRKEADQIWSNQWRDGIVDSDGNAICSSLNMTEKTFRTHLNELVERDFLNAYACVDESGNENVARLYEINFTKILAPYTAEGSRMAHLNLPKHLKNARKDGDSGESGDEEGSKSYGRGVVKSNPLNISNKRIGKPILSAGVPRSGRVVAGTEDNSDGNESPAYEDPPEPSVAGIIEALTTKHKAKQADRLRAATTRSPWELDKRELEALLNRAMERYHPKLPRMVVTAKEHSVLRRRLKESAPKDFSDFIDYTIRSWYSFSVQQQNKALRDAGTGQTKRRDVLGECPDFKALAFRYTYFLKCHSNHVIRQNGVEQEKDEDRRVIAAQKQEIANLKQTVKVMRRRKPVAVERAPAVREAIPERRGVRVVNEIDFTSRFRPEDEPEFPTEFIDGSPEQYGARRLRNGK